MLDTTRLVPLFSHVLIRMNKVEAKTAGGIILPESEQDRQNFGRETGEIIKIGEHAFKVKGADTKFIPKAGDSVLVYAHAGAAHTVGDDIYRIVSDRDIIAVTEVS